MGHEDVILNIDDNRIQLAFFNVLYNAITYSDKESNNILVELGKLHSNGRPNKQIIYIDISNWGPGIALEEKEDVFKAGFIGSKHAPSIHQ